MPIDVYTHFSNSNCSFFAFSLFHPSSTLSLFAFVLHQGHDLPSFRFLILMSINLHHSTLPSSEAASKASSLASAPKCSSRSSSAESIVADSSERIAPKLRKEFPTILQRKDSSILNSMAGPRSNLQYQPSKLDLIDDTTLTSLPLPPPPPKIRLRRGDLASTNSGSLLDFTAPSRNLADSIHSNDHDDNIGDKLETDIVDATFCSEADETFDESEDPIVLVEDYMTNDTSEIGTQQKLDRKKSLANFKKRLHARLRSSTLLSISSSHTTNKRTVSEERDVPFRQCEDLEAIFGKIPGADKLKHCSLCDKPLYEISSIINAENVPRNPELMKNINQLYNEFVCWDCINTYETFLDELFVTELNEANEPANQVVQSGSDGSTEKLLGIFNSIRNTYDTPEAIQPPKKQSKRAFSNDLLGRLHYLSSMSTTPKSEAEWLKNLRNRLRWRWRINGLIPNPFASERQLEQ